MSEKVSQKWLEDGLGRTQTTTVAALPDDHPPSPADTQVASNNNSIVAIDTPTPPPDGGYGWVCTVCVATVNAHTWGLNSSYGVFLAYYLANDLFPGATSMEYAFIGSLTISCALLVSPAATLGVRKFGTRKTMFLGVVLESLGLICASFATQIWHLFLTQGILLGFGIGFLFVSSVPIVPQWFTTKRSLATGFTISGSGLGGLIYSFATGAMIQNLGLAWTFRILGIVAFVVNTVCSILIKDHNKAATSTVLAFDFSLCKRSEFLLLLGYGWGSMFAYVVLIFSLANYANEIGLDASQAALISAFFNMGQTFGSPLIGYFSDRVGRISMAALMTFLAGFFSLAIWISAKQYGILIFYSVICGAVAGTFWVTAAPVAAEIVGLKNVASGLNILWMAIVLPCLFAEPIALQIKDSTGNYLGTQIWVGLMYVAAAICTGMLRGWKIGEVKEIARITNQAPEKLDRERIDENEELVNDGRRVGRKRMLIECWKWKKV